MVALTGPSGCGKSTLLNLVGCVDLPTSGTVIVEGRATTRLSDNELTDMRCNRVGTVFQFFNLLPSLSVTENVAVPLVLQKRGRTEIAARVADALDAVGIRAKNRAFPEELSGGEAQRVAIARAIVHAPAILLADEPTGNLDGKNAGHMMDLFRELADSGQAILLATHSLEAASRCDRIFAMRDGRLE
jgi:putative ABC transport system ATP-binding protein